MTSRSVWHNPAALIRTRTSLPRSGLATTVSIRIGARTACSTAARYSRLIRTLHSACQLPLDPGGGSVGTKDKLGATRTPQISGERYVGVLARASGARARLPDLGEREPSRGQVRRVLAACRGGNRRRGKRRPPGSKARTGGRGLGR